MVMVDLELIAAVLTSGMLPPVPAPVAANRTEREDTDISQAVAHAANLYRAVLEAIRIKE
jgi:hypothetical protein